MASKTITAPFLTREKAEEHQRTSGTTGYSERYARGITERTAPDGTTIYVSTVQEYAG